jgi:hypothetical protein
MRTNRESDKAPRACCRFLLPRGTANVTFSATIFVQRDQKTIYGLPGTAVQMDAPKRTKFLIYRSPGVMKPLDCLGTRMSAGQDRHSISTSFAALSIVARPIEI